MNPHYKDSSVTLHHGDCLEVLKQLPDNSVDSVVTDPPYGIAFMGKQWDQPGEYGSIRASTGLNKVRGAKDAALEAGKYDLSPGAMRNFQRWCEAWSAECLRILKPGGHLVAFGGSRTWHRLASAVEDAGFEIRDSIAWLYGSGFPKSLDVSKAIDKSAGAVREQGELGRDRVSHLRNERYASGPAEFSTERGTDLAAAGGPPVTEAAQRWDGWGTALKPAFEPIVVGRKPFTGTVAANVQQQGTGALNIGGCRIHTADSAAKAYTVKRRKPGATLNKTGGNWRPEDDDAPTFDGETKAGRWPTNVVLDDSQAAALDEQAGTRTSGANPTRRSADKFRDAYGDFKGQSEIVPARAAESGGASRFFPTFHYEAKAPTGQRPNVGGVAHPTVKPLDLMRWLVRLVTPPGGTVLEPFAGSGTTAEACVIEGMHCIAIEREAEYLPLIVARLSKPIQVGLDFDEETA